jgi:hypothetical protein
MSNPRRLASYIEEALGMPCFSQLKSGREGYQQIVASLREMDADKLHQLYDLANKELEYMSQTMFAKRAVHLWFFSHPTFEIFSSFLSDDGLMKGFISYVLAIPRCRKRKNQIKKSKLRAEMHKAKTMLLFVEPYLELVRTSLEVDHISIGPIDKKLARNAVPLVSITPPTKADERAAHIAFFTAQMKAEKEAFEKTSIGKRISQLTSFLTSVELIETEVESRLPELYQALGTPPTKVKGEYVHGVDQRISQRIYEAMTCGSWVRFKPFTVKPCKMVVDVSDDEKASVGKVAFNIIKGHTSSAIEPWVQMKGGCLPVGLKVHALKKIPDLQLRGQTWFKLEAASRCIVLPPVANADAAIDLLGVLERRLGETIIDNEDYQIQVCSQSRLTAERAAHLGTAFYLGSDRIRTYNQRSLKTSHNETGKRLVVYGAGVCEKHFDWCGMDADGNVVVGPPPDAIHCRTDVLWCHSRRDVFNVNLIATLLVHDQFDGFWKPLGDTFQIALRDILDRHHLSGVLDAPWVKTGGNEDDGQDEVFETVFEELSAYALSEAGRLRDNRIPLGGILAEVNDLLEYCHDTVKGGPQ